MIISNRFKSPNSTNNKNTYKPEQLGEINHVKERIETGDLLFENTSCPCGGEDYGVIASVDRYGLSLETVLCDTCGSLRFKEYFSDKSLADFYINHYQKMYGRLGNVPEYFERQKTYGKRIYKTYEKILSKEDNVLEIGCGAGGALKYFQQQGLNVFGCEYSKTLVEYANGKGLKNVFHGSLFEVSKSIPDEFKFKVIYIHHVFEHVNDPIALLKICRSLLSIDGRLVIGVPDFLNIDKFENPGCDLLPFIHVAHKYNFTTNCFETMADQTNLGYNRVSLDERYSTPWAVQPELWGEFKKVESKAILEGSKSINYGNHVFQYLKNTESDFSNNTCIGTRNKINQKSILSKLVSVFSK